MGAVAAAGGVCARRLLEWVAAVVRVTKDLAEDLLQTLCGIHMYTDYHIIDFSIIPSAMRFDTCDTRQHRKMDDVQEESSPHLLVRLSARRAAGRERRRRGVGVALCHRCQHLTLGGRTSQKDSLITMQGSGSALADTRDAKTRRTAAVSCAGLKKIMVVEAVARMVSLEALGTASG